MPPETGYQRQVAPRPAAAMPAASPDQYGAGFGRALEQAGKDLHREQLEDYGIARKAEADAERTDRFRALSEWKAQTLEARDLMQAEAQPGAAGHVEGIAELIGDEAAAPLFEGVREDSTRRWLEQELAAFRGQVTVAEQNWALAKGVEKTLADAGTGLDVLVTAAQRSTDKQGWPDANRQWAEYVDGLRGLDGNKKQELLDKGYRSLGLAQSQDMIAQDPHAFLAIEGAGAFDDVLTPEDRRQLREKAEVEIRSLEVQAAREEAVAVAELRDDVRLFMEMEEQGRANFDELPALLERARAAEEDTLVAQLEEIGAGEIFSRQYQGAPPVQLEQRLAALNRKASLSDEEKLERSWIEGHLPTIEGRYNRDPVGFYAREGGGASADRFRRSRLDCGPGPLEPRARGQLAIFRQ